MYELFVALAVVLLRLWRASDASRLAHVSVGSSVSAFSTTGSLALLYRNPMLQSTQKAALDLSEDDVLHAVPR